MNRFRPFVMRLWAAGVLALLVYAPAAFAQASFEAAEEAYLSADFEAAHAQFSQLAGDASLPLAQQIQVYQYLGRASIAMDQDDAARQALRDMLGLEPPLIELDPDLEPPPLMDLYYDLRSRPQGGEVRGEARDFTIAQSRDTDIQTIAVIDFNNNAFGLDAAQYDRLQKGFASMMINQIAGVERVKVVERERLQWLLQELELQRDPKLIDQTTAVQAGKLLGVHAVFLGFFSVFKNKLTLGSRLVKVETGQTLFGETVNGKLEDYYDLITDLSGHVLESLDRKLDKDRLGGRADTRSFEAMMAYSEGLDLLEQKKYREAHAQFEAALALDPAYERARVKAQSLLPLIQ